MALFIYILQCTCTSVLVLFCVFANYQNLCADNSAISLYIGSSRPLFYIVYCVPFRRSRYWMLWIAFQQTRNLEPSREPCNDRMYVA